MDIFLREAMRLIRYRPGYFVACVACYLAIMALALCVSAVGVLL